jgi:hypothetical protein
MGDTRRTLKALGLGPARLAAGPESGLAILDGQGSDLQTHH